MSHKVNVVHTKFTNLENGNETYGVRIYDEFGSTYDNTFGSVEELKSKVNEDTVYDYLKDGFRDFIIGETDIELTEVMDEISISDDRLIIDEDENYPYMGFVGITYFDNEGKDIKTSYGCLLENEMTGSESIIDLGLDSIENLVSKDVTDDTYKAICKIAAKKLRRQFGFDKKDKKLNINGKMLDIGFINEEDK